MMHLRPVIEAWLRSDKASNFAWHLADYRGTAEDKLALGAAKTRKIVEEKQMKTISRLRYAVAA